MVQTIAPAALGAAAQDSMNRQGIPAWPTTATYMNEDEKLYRILVAACPGATVKAGRVLEGGGDTVLTFRCRAVVSAPNIKEPIKLSGHSAADATATIKKQWATQRRAYDVDRLKEECQRLAGGNLTEDQLAHLENDMLHCEQVMYEAEAARRRKSAQALGELSQQAA